MLEIIVLISLIYIAVLAEILGKKQQFLQD